MANDGSPVSLLNVTDDNISQLKRLNTVLFPFNYPQTYYAAVLASGDFSKLAYCEQTCAGSITCRLERTFGGKRLYIYTLGVLAPFRRQGIDGAFAGSKLMKSILELCERSVDILEVYLHVQINNEEALEFYRKFDFTIQELIKNYYRRTEPRDCYLLSKKIREAGSGLNCVH